jgi:MFS transporter, DHA2 family, multidrug resistance protein
MANGRFSAFTDPAGCRPILCADRNGVVLRATSASSGCSTFGAVLQTARLFGAELGSGFMQTFVRVSEQTESYLLGLHVQRGGGLVTHRLAEVASALVGRSVGEADASARSADLLAQSVRVQANVLATIDGFYAVAFGVVVMLCVMILLREPEP